MKFLVLGSNSYAGSSLIDYLLDLEHQVVGISRSKESHDTLRAYSKNKNVNNFRFYQLDLNKDSEKLFELIKKFKPSYVIDFAGQGMVAESWQQPDQWYQTNIVSKVRLHEFLRSCDFIEKYVRVSTPEVYGHTENKATEDTRFNPSTPYAVSHAAVDMSLLAFAKQYHFPVVLTRFANFYGSHQQLYRIIPRTMIYSMTGRKLPLHGGGRARRAFIHGADVARGIVLAATKGGVGETYHFSTEEIISIADLVKKICHLTKTSFGQFAEITEDRPGKDTQYMMDFSKAQRELAWSPTISLDDGLSQTLEWIQHDIEVIKNLPLTYVHKA